MEVTEAWYWEGNVVDVLAGYLERDGWMIVSKADTHSKERGVDLHARKDDRDLLVEANGFPSKTYRDPRRASDRKPTNPNNQAQQWYSHALLKAVRFRPNILAQLLRWHFLNLPATALCSKRHM